MKAFGVFAIGALIVGLSVAPAAEPPAVGEQAEDFELKTVEGESVSLAKLAEEGPVAILVLRGYPGYQCPICSLQMGSFLSKAKDFADAGSQVLMIYPGPADSLDDKAKQFLGKRELPEGFHFVVDPDYTFVNQYHLRWDAPRETAYPSTFVIDSSRKIHFAKISKTHGGRTKASEVLEAVQKAKS